MTEPQHARLRSLFDQALALPAAQRAAWLARECAGEAELEERLGAMLAAAEDVHFLAAPVGMRLTPTGLHGILGSDDTSAIPSEGPGTRIGQYKLLQLIGEGGFGSVFLAEQEKPVVRRVALKIIKLGMDTRTVVARFEQERQALAMMDHPNIARVFDAGATETGRPYFVMELVKGEPIAAYCDKNQLSIDERLELFAQVCNAVQHAHAKGVIHRDLKPSNILIGTQDGRPQAKIIDFGIAKATSAKLTDKTLFTEHKQVIGTLQYMSPEQAEGSLDIDTRTDVYALGVVLYELLTGSTPFDTKTMSAAYYSEIQRMIREDEPPKPSTRLHQSADTLGSIAARRRITPKRLGAIVRGELDWIVMKALEKDRSRRYQTANGLGEDVRRFLSGEAVLAAPPSSIYRLQKFVRRNRATVISGSAVATALLIGVIGFAWQAQIAKANEARAVDLEKLATQRAADLVVATQAAVASQRIATQKANDVLSLSAIQELKELSERADVLWPAFPVNLDAYDRWLAEARVLIDGRAADPAHSIAAHPSLKEHEAKLAEIRSRAKSTAASSSEEHTFEFDDAQDRWWHAQLTQLVADLKAFRDEPTGGLYSTGTSEKHGWGILERREFANSIAERSVDGMEATRRWAEAIARIAQSPRYAGLKLMPQLGLLPIGEDPSSGLWEFGHLQTGEVAERGDESKLILKEATGLVFVLLPGGTFQMGAQKTDPSGPNYDPQALPTEGPVHAVTLSTFFLSKYEMTQAQWLRLAGVNPSYYKPGKQSKSVKSLVHPVEQVSWNDCMRELGRMGLSLPSEAQWEYGARGGTQTAWWTGNERDSLVGATNLADAAAQRAGAPWIDIKDWPELDDGFVLHAPVDSLRPNGFGLHCVHGNVWEWCLDGFDANYFKQAAATDPVSPPESSNSRINRGGSFANAATQARCANRPSDAPTIADRYLGLRPAMILRAPGPSARSGK